MEGGAVARRQHWLTCDRRSAASRSEVRPRSRLKSAEMAALFLRQPCCRPERSTIARCSLVLGRQAARHPPAPDEAWWGVIFIWEFARVAFLNSQKALCCDGVAIRAVFQLLQNERQRRPLRRRIGVGGADPPGLLNFGLPSKGLSNQYASAVELPESGGTKAGDPEFWWRWIG
jgi:hypothetical protein